MKKSIQFAFATLVLLSSTGNTFAQCADEANVTSYTYNGTTYEVVLENQTWVDAAACAVERGGHLIEINDVNEQDAIFGNLPIINFTNTTAPDGGGGGYLWIGGNDMATEGNWIWDGNNDSNGTQFWSGDASGTPVGGLYNNWGNEPDDFGNGQDALAYAITNWPLGLQEQWNDVDINNSLYYIIEYSTASLEESFNLEPSLMYPNPATESIEIEMSNVVSFTINDVNGALVTSMENNTDAIIKIDVSEYLTGVYFVSFELLNGEVVREKFIKQ